MITFITSTCFLNVCRAKCLEPQCVNSSRNHNDSGRPFYFTSPAMPPMGDVLDILGNGWQRGQLKFRVPKNKQPVAPRCLPAAAPQCVDSSPNHNDSGRPFHFTSPAMPPMGDRCRAKCLEPQCVNSSPNHNDSGRPFYFTSPAMPPMGDGLDILGNGWQRAQLKNRKRNSPLPHGVSRTAPVLVEHVVRFNF
ncbi:hypothetical protein CEXT_202351 [Caerostris extrusa]|uniref:Uncharacterized protein n=1 Tax=Caerostris extrusa TaxID=172846 RepID=A0AAV4R2X0_CAEEX|nr:hypothetical protein CEXT_202351 [Caerostris extrusa]